MARFLFTCGVHQLAGAFPNQPIKQSTNQRFHLLLILFALFSPFLAAQPPADDFRLDAQIGLDPSNMVVPGAHNPYRLEFTNERVDFEGTLWLTVRNSHQPPGAQERVVYETGLSLPLHSTKVIDGLIFIPPDGTEIEIRLTQNNGQAFEMPMFVGFGNLDPQRRAALVVSREPRAIWDGLRTPPNIFLGLGRQVLRSPPENLSPHFAAYDPLSTIIWDGEWWANLDSSHSTAIHTWVERGGMLTIGTGQAWQVLQDSPLGPLTPLSFASSELVSAETAAGAVGFHLQDSLVLARFDETTLPPRARVLSRLNDIPLFVTWPVGQGHILLCTASLQSLWNAAPAAREMLANIITSPSDAPLTTHHSDFAASADASLAHISRVNLPTHWEVGQWLLALWIVLLTVNFALARVFRRPRLAWIMAPLLASGATLFVVRQGIAGVRPGDTVQQVQVIVCPPHSSTAQVEGVISIYAHHETTISLLTSAEQSVVAPIKLSTHSPLQETYSLRTGGEAGLHRHPMRYGSLRSLRLSAITENPIRAQVQVNRRPAQVICQWSDALSPYARRWYVINGHRVTQIVPADAERAGSITINEHEYTLADTWAFQEDGGQMLEEIAPAIIDEANRCAPVCLVGIRDKAMAPVQSAFGDTSFGESEHRGWSIFIVPAEETMQYVGGGVADWPHWRWTSPRLIQTSDQTQSVDLPFNAQQDTQLHLQPRRGRWSQLRPDTFSFTPSVNAATQDAIQMRIHLALLSWQRLSWQESSQNAFTNAFVWNAPSEYLHPVTGELLMAMWAVRANTGGELGFGDHLLPPPGTGDEPYDWRVGPEHDRRTMSIQGGNFAVQLGAVILRGQLEKEHR